jgi:hypothetical protein
VLECADGRAEVLAERGRARRELLVDEHLERGDGDGAAEGVSAGGSVSVRYGGAQSGIFGAGLPAVGAAVFAGLDDVHDVFVS